MRPPILIDLRNAFPQGAAQAAGFQGHAYRPAWCRTRRQTPGRRPFSPSRRPVGPTRRTSASFTPRDTKAMTNLTKRSGAARLMAAALCATVPDVRRKPRRGKPAAVRRCQGHDRIRSRGPLQRQVLAVAGRGGSSRIRLDVASPRSPDRERRRTGPKAAGSSPMGGAFASKPTGMPRRELPGPNLFRPPGRRQHEIYQRRSPAGDWFVFKHAQAKPDDEFSRPCPKRSRPRSGWKTARSTTKRDPAFLGTLNFWSKRTMSKTNKKLRGSWRSPLPRWRSQARLWRSNTAARCPIARCAGRRPGRRQASRHQRRSIAFAALDPHGDFSARRQCVHRTSLPSWEDVDLSTPWRWR